MKNLRADPRVRAVVERHAAAGKWLAAICAAPTVLNASGLLDGRRYTAHFSVAGELPHILADQRVVADGNILTSRGAGTALDFGTAAGRKARVGGEGPRSRPLDLRLSRAQNRLVTCESCVQSRAWKRPGLPPWP